MAPNVVPAFKKGDRGKAENYQPISLTSVLCKTLEHIIHSHLMKHFDQYYILCDEHGMVWYGILGFNVPLDTV